MAMNYQVTADSILTHAQSIGLPLSVEEAAKMLVGVRRTREMADAVRRLVGAEVEPAGVFTAKGPAS
jgi:hypothetical protein